MFVYLVRHGESESKRKGGWGDSSLTEGGICQLKELVKTIEHRDLGISVVYSSDMVRSLETAEPIAKLLGIPVIKREDFRPPNNGLLANMFTDEANKCYPNLHYYTLDYEECYPEGESPRAFFERISETWERFSKSIDCNCILFTHSSVIRAIYCIVKKIKYNNKEKNYISEAKLLPIEIRNGTTTCKFEI